MNTATMRALVADAYGGVEDLRFADVAMPDPGPGEVRVRVAAASINIADWAGLRGKPYLIRPMRGGVRRPGSTPFGRDMSGVVDAVGSDVDAFAVGDEVFGEVEGSLAEYTVVPSSNIALRPRSISFAEAAAIPIGGMTALQGVRDTGGTTRGTRLLVNGASGGVGTFAVRIGAILGAHVTAVCSTSHVEAMRAIGADRVIDYTSEDFTDEHDAYDVVFDLIANCSLSDIANTLRQGGTYVSSAGIVGGDWFGPIWPLLRPTLGGLFRRQRMTAVAQKIVAEDLVTLAQWVDEGSLRPVVADVYEFAEADAAFTRLGAGHLTGRIVVTM